ncbi:MAG: hypothetical protein M5T61_07200 [Acidimicrobiia bacterium]|nr:hypothetical protein [Acidimicrobiia bacterium]
MAVASRDLRPTERWFERRGIPHFIADYSAERDIWTRTLPALTLLFLVEVVNAPSESFPIWLDALAVVGGFGILLGAWALVNVWRRRPALSRPEDLGAVEIAVFVLAPAVIPVVFGGQWRAAVGTAALNVGLLGLIYFGTSYGVVPLTRWGAGQLVRQLGSVTNLLVRALPLLLLFVTFLFINTEVWQTASGLEWPAVALVAGLFAMIGTAFAAMRLPRQVGELSLFESWEKTAERVAGTPAEALAQEVEEPESGTAALSRRQWGNVGLVVLVSEGIQILIVTVLIGLFFGVFGFLAIEEPVVVAWLGHAPDRLWTLDLWGQEMVLTWELLRVATFLASFSGLYFTVVLLTDATYREEFLEEVLAEVRDAFAVRAVYLAARGDGAAATVTPGVTPGGPTTLSPT